MVSTRTVRQLSLGLPEVTEQPHFHLSSFRIKNKIFATLWEAEKKIMVKLSLTDQSVFCDIDKDIIYPVPGAWGKQGATFIELYKIKKQVVADALTCAWQHNAPKTIRKKYMPTK